MEATDTTAQTRPPQQVIDEFVGVSHGDYARVKTLLEQYPSLANVTSSWGETPIEAAAQMGRRDIADLLLAAGAPLDICTAAVFGMDDTVEELLAADPNAPQATGAHGIPLLYYPVIGGHQALAEHLLALGADPNAGAGGNTPLHGAAMFGNAALAEWLLANGARPDALNYEGKTPRQVALDANHQSVADAITRHEG